jgi:hypothetical protein
MVMAVTPKTSKGIAGGKTGSTTLSASEALKAAEAAIGIAPQKKPVLPKPVSTPPSSTKVKPIDASPQRKPVVAKSTAPKAVIADPVAVIAATTAVDAAPEPEPIAAPKADISPSEPKESLIAKAEPIMTKPLPAEGTKTMTDVIETGKKFAEDTKAKFETAYADFNGKAKAGVEKSTKAIEEFSDIAKGNVEALVESGKIAAKGMETLGQEAVDYSRKNFEKATASFKTFSTVKTPTEFFQLQSQLFSTSFDEFTKEAAKHSEAFMKLAGDVAQPLTARVTLVTDKVKSLAA